MAQQYETVFIVTPIVSDDNLKEIVNSYEKFLKKESEKIIHNESWGLKKFSYPIENKNSGYYFLYEYQAGPEVVKRLEDEFDRDQRILRYLTVELNQYAVEYNEKRRKKNKKKGASSKKKKTKAKT